MDTLTHHTLDLALDEFAELDAIGITNRNEGGVDLWIQLRADVLAVKGHGSGGYAGAFFFDCGLQVVEGIEPRIVGHSIQKLVDP
jgi:hypothetical protein